MTVMGTVSDRKAFMCGRINNNHSFKTKIDVNLLTIRTHVSPKNRCFAICFKWLIELELRVRRSRKLETIG